ncbi:MAG: hypothetical protein HRU20_03050 [Pseudomonadales bacterium]|nr:hypothetical protein [Pseudomonadales bacterium]
MYTNTEKTKKTSITAACVLAGSVLLPMLATAAEIDVKITNLTQGIYFTPLLVASHGDNQHLFETGMAASSSLQAMAEGGDIAALISDAEGLGAMVSANPAGGLLAPSTSTMVSALDTGSNMYLSITAMILPSNDGFVGLDSWMIPEQAGEYTIYLNAYDAGTEANDELITGGGASGVAGIPFDPAANNGTGGTGVTNTEAVSNIHIHRGNVGDTDASGGSSDLDSRIHRWLNPVAKVVVTVKGDM